MFDDKIKPSWFVSSRKKNYHVFKRLLKKCEELIIYKLNEFLL